MSTGDENEIYVSSLEEELELAKRNTKTHRSPTKFYAVVTPSNSDNEVSSNESEKSLDDSRDLPYEPSGLLDDSQIISDRNLRSTSAPNLILFPDSVTTPVSVIAEQQVKETTSVSFIAEPKIVITHPSNNNQTKPISVTKLKPILNMSELSLKDMSQMLPNLQNDPKSLEFFINKGDLIFNSLTTEPSKSLFLHVVKSSLVDTLKLKVTDLDSWSLIKQALIATVLPTKSLNQLNDELFKMSQQTNESIQSFSDRILQVTNAINQQFSLSNPDAKVDALTLVYGMNKKTALSVFVNGLIGEVKIYVKARNFLEFGEAVSFAKMEEHNVSKAMVIWKPEPELSQPQVQNQPQVNRTQVPLENPIKAERKSRVNQNFTCFKCGNDGHLANYCKMKSNNARGNNPQSGFSKPVVICNFCNRKGHAEETCFLAKQAKGKACSYCGMLDHTTQNCVRQIVDQPGNQSRQINHLTANPQFLSHVDIPSMVENLAVRLASSFSNNHVNPGYIQNLGNFNGNYQGGIPNQNGNFQGGLYQNQNFQNQNFQGGISNQNGNYQNGNYQNQNFQNQDSMRNIGNINHIQRVNTPPVQNNQLISVDSFNQNPQNANVNHMQRQNNSNQISLMDLHNPSQNQVNPNTDLFPLGNSSNLETSAYQMIGSGNQGQNIHFRNSD